MHLLRVAHVTWCQSAIQLVSMQFQHTRRWQSSQLLLHAASSRVTGVWQHGQVKLGKQAFFVLLILSDELWTWFVSCKKAEAVAPQNSSQIAMCTQNMSSKINERDYGRNPFRFKPGLGLALVPGTMVPDEGPSMMRCTRGWRWSFAPKKNTCMRNRTTLQWAHSSYYRVN